MTSRADSRLLPLRHPVLRVAALGAASAVAVLSRGDALVLAVLLGVTAFDLASGTAAGLVAVGTLARLGTTSLAAAAGAQSVLGPSGITGPPSAALSAWLGAAALVLASPPGWAALPFGLTAALVLEGPAATSPAALVVRVMAMVALVDCASASGRWLPRLVSRPAAVVCGALSLVLGLIASPPGALNTGHAVRWAAIPEAVALVAAGVLVALVVPRAMALVRPVEAVDGAEGEADRTDGSLARPDA